MLTQFLHKAKLFDVDYLGECQDAFETLRDLHGRFESRLLALTTEGPESDLSSELDRVGRLWRMGVAFFVRQREQREEKQGESSSTVHSPTELKPPARLALLLVKETEVDAALYNITQSSQYLEQAANSIADDDSDEDKKNAIEPAFTDWENTLNTLADSEDLRKLTPRESVDRLALVQSVRYFVNESVEALVGKAVVLPDDFKTNLADRLEALLERSTEIAAVVRFGVDYKEQKELKAEVSVCPLLCSGMMRLMDVCKARGLARYPGTSCRSVEASGEG